MICVSINYVTIFQTQGCRTNTRKCQFSITVYLLLLVNRHDKLYFVTIRQIRRNFDLQNMEIQKYETRYAKIINKLDSNVRISRKKRKVCPCLRLARCAKIVHTLYTATGSSAWTWKLT